MRVLNELPKIEGRGAGRKKESKWKDLELDTVYLLERGVDYNCKDKSLVTLLRHEAKRRGVRVAMRTTKEGLAVKFFTDNGQTVKNEEILDDVESII